MLHVDLSTRICLGQTVVMRANFIQSFTAALPHPQAPLLPLDKEQVFWNVLDIVALNTRLHDVLNRGEPVSLVAENVVDRFVEMT